MYHVLTETSHICPTKPVDVQLHLNPPFSCWHDPLFWQGSGLQASAEVSHLSVGKESNKNDKYVINNPNNSDILLEVISHKIVNYHKL